MSTPETSAIPMPNPFVGPRPMERGDALFGRDAEIEQLYYLLSAERIVLLHSPSGAGKSSLVQAGLIPRLTSHFDYWGPVRVNLQPLPGTTPEINRFTRSCILGFESELPERLRRPESDIASLTLAQYLASRPASLRRRNAPENTVLIFDQFEEILTADPLAQQARTAFFTELGTLLQEDPHLWALFILREDYLAPLDPYANLLPTHLKTRFRLDLFSRTAAAESIQKSIESAGRTIDPVALVSLVSDLAMMQVQQPDGSFVSEPGPYVEPLHLQVACRNLWDRLPPTQTLIQSQDLDSFGGVTQALSDFYATELQRASADDHNPEATERLLRDWIGTRLITPGDIRTQVLREQGRSGNLENHLIERLVRTHLIRAEQRAGATWYELSHDRLIRPIRTSNIAWFDRHLSTLQKAAALWAAQGEAPGLLLTGTALSDARSMFTPNHEFVSDTERDFLAKCIEKQQSLDREASAARRLRAFVAYAIASAIVAIGFMIAAILKSREAKAAEEQAYLSTVKTEATTPGHAGVALAYLSRLLHLNPDSGPAAAYASGLLTQQLWWLPSLVLDKQPISVADLSADAKIVITVGTAGAIQFWDADTGASLSPSSSIAGPPSYDIERSPDDRHVLIVSGPNAGLWDLSTHQPACTLTIPSGSIRKERFSFDGSRFVTSSSDGFARVWDAATCNPVSPPIHPPSQEQGTPSAEISGDGHRIVTYFSGNTQVWDAVSGSPVGPVHALSSTAYLDADGTHLLVVEGTQARLIEVATGKSFVFSDDKIAGRAVFAGNNRYVVVTAGDKVSLWGLNPNTLIRSIILGSDAIDSQVSADGSRVASFTLANTAYVWSSNTGTLLGDPLLYGADLVNYRLSPNGNRIMTSSDNAAQLWTSVDARDIVFRNLTPPVQFEDLQLTSNGIRILVLTTDGMLRTLDQDGKQVGSPVPMPRQSGELGPRAKAMAVYTHNAKLVADGARILVGQSPNAAQLWDMEGKPVGKPLPTGIVWSDPRSRSILIQPLPVFSSTGQASDTGTSRLAVVDAMTGELLNSIPTQDLQAGVVVHVSSNDRYLVTASPSLMRLQDLKSGAIIRDIACTGPYFTGNVAFSPDGERFALGCGLHLSVFTSKRGNGLGPEFTLRNPVSSLAFTPDGKRLIIGTGGTVLIWDIASAQFLGDTIRPAFNTGTIKVSPDGKRIATVAQNTIELWDASTGRSIRPATTVDGKGFPNQVEFTPDGRSLVLGRYGIENILSLRLTLGSGSASDTTLLSELAEVAGGYHFNAATGSATLIAPGERSKRLLEMRRAYHVPPDQEVVRYLIQRLAAAPVPRR